MRSKEEILEPLKGMSVGAVPEIRAIVEILADIRDLLTNQQ